MGKVVPSTKTLPPAMSALLEKLRTLMDRAATAEPAALASIPLSGPRMILAPSSAALLAMAAACAGLPAVL